MSHRRIPNSHVSALGAVVTATHGTPDPLVTRIADVRYDKQVSVVSLISAFALKNPTAEAVISGQGTLTYSELEARSTVLACHLCSLGLTQGSVVGLLAHRSIPYVVGALGIMKAGAAYLPIQPNVPKKRVNFQLEDAGAEVMVAEEGRAGRSGDWSRTILRLAQDGLLLTNEANKCAVANVNTEDLAYVIYTSGSTGQPKGVEVTHGNLLNLAQWHHRAFDVTVADRASLVSNVGVDAAVWELWPYLAAGASVHIVDDAIAKNPEALKDWLVAEKITIGFAPTALAEQLMELRWPAETELRILLTGGDLLHSYPSRELPFQVVNNYGPTECTVVAASATLKARDLGAGLPPIGKPIANTQIYILDEQMLAVAAGGVGEIWIGGMGVARGYRNRPGLTAEKFMPNPFADGDGDRLYRTGDRGRLLADGQITFLGRIDEQIKVRGFRVEPGEIESALNQHPAIDQSSVNLVEMAPGEKRLIAHVIVRGEAPTPKELQAFVSERLPDYMVPSAFVRLEKFPLLQSGKIDRRELDPPSPLNTLMDDSQVAARTVTEKRLQQIVSSLLKTEKVGVEDNFFMLGGHSLLAAQLIARVRDAFGIEIGLRFVFECPTVTAIAKEIERIVRLKVDAMTEEQAQQVLEKHFAVTSEGA